MAEPKYISIAKILFQNFDKNKLFSKEEAYEYVNSVLNSTIRTNSWNALLTHNLIIAEDKGFKLGVFPDSFSHNKKTKSVNTSSYSERQGHGFAFEDYVEKTYGVNRDGKSYTSKWDGVLNGVPVSIKTAKIGTDIEMADFTRNAENTEDFYLFVGFWEEEKTNIVEEYILFIPGQEWHSFFPSHFIVDFREMLNNITNDYADDEKWRSMISEQKEKWQNETNNLIRPRFKRDHKTQKRVQCAINNTDFFSYFIPKYRQEI